MSTTATKSARMDVTGTLPMTGLVFVYGTLKRAYWNNKRLEDSKFLGTAYTAQPYPMVCGGIPFLYDRPGEGKVVQGEVFEVTNPDVMENLDRLESHPHGYKRTLFKCILRDETKHGSPIREIEAFVYFDQRPLYKRSDDEFQSEYKPE